MLSRLAQSGHSVHRHMMIMNRTAQLIRPMTRSFVSVRNPLTTKVSQVATPLSTPVRTISIALPRTVNSLFLAPRRNEREQDERKNRRQPLSRFLLVSSAAVASSLVYALSRDDATIYAAGATFDARVSGQAPAGVEQTLFRGSKLFGAEDWMLTSYWWRFAAFLIDNTIVSIVFSVAHTLLVGEYEVYAVPLSVLFNFSYEVVSNNTLCYMYNDGATLGKYVCGIKVLRDDGHPLDFYSASMYFVGKLLNVFLLADVIWGLLDISGDYKCLHNVLSNTVVVQKQKFNEHVKV